MFFHWSVHFLQVISDDIHIISCISSVVATPVDSIVVQRRSKSKSYRLSYRSGLGAASRLCPTPALTTRRLNTSRKPPKSTNIAVSWKEPHVCHLVIVWKKILNYSFLLKENVSPEHLALLVKTEWQLSFVTPLYQFRHTQLKNYSRQLAAFIAAEKQQGLAVEVEGAQSNFKVCFSVLQGMVATGNDAETVLIQVIVGLLQRNTCQCGSLLVCRAINSSVFTQNKFSCVIAVYIPLSLFFSHFHSMKIKSKWSLEIILDCCNAFLNLKTRTVFHE